ncbi:MAG: DNA polymerase/3'-5' exonuclease PolX [Abditibacteriaceae bacterium]
MLNAAITELFRELATYMQIAGENQYKIRAYKNTADAVANLKVPVKTLAFNRQLENIDGLGESSINKINEYLSTGKIKDLENLRKDYPAGLLDLLHLPGLGAKRIGLLYETQGIDSLDALRTAMETDQLKHLPGFSAKNVIAMRRVMDHWDELRRLPLEQATQIAEQFLETLRQCRVIERVEIVGSLRRGKDTVGDIDFLAQCKNAEDAQKYFCSLTGILQIVERTADVSTIRVPPGVNMSLEICDSVNWGTRYFYGTGSKEHVRQAIERAHTINVDLDSQEEEKSIYTLLNVPFIVPQLREGRGEWEAAAQDNLPQLIEQKQLRGDLHTHSEWSDGKNTIKQMARACRERGYEYFVVTDHSKALAVTNGLDASRLRQQTEEIADLQSGFPDLRILRGVECDIMEDGSLDLEDDILFELDLVIISVHSGFHLDKSRQTDRIIRALQHPAVHLMAHPTGRILGRRPPYEMDIDAVITAASEMGKALEINSTERLDLSDTNAFKARQQKVLLSIDSDAHSTQMLDNVQHGVTTAQRAWCEGKDILNTKPLDELLKWLRRE